MDLLSRLIGVTAISCLLCMNAAAVSPAKVDTVGVGTVKTTSAATAQDTLVVIARLSEIPGKFAPNELYDYVYIMKYRVLKVEKGSLQEQEILVGHYNPLIARKKVSDKMDPLVGGTVERFVVGAKHRLTLIAPIERVWTGAIEDEYIDLDTEKYYALKTDMVP